MPVSDIRLPKFFPRIIGRCLVIPLVTIVLLYPTYAIIGTLLLATFGFSTLGGKIMIDPIIVKEVAGIGIVVVMTSILFIFSFLNRLGKQKTQAKEIEIRMSYGYEPTIEELLDMEKVKTVNKIYKIALVFGIVLASVIGGLVTYYILAPGCESDAKFYFLAFAVSFLCYLMVDYAVKSVANGEFEKCKQEMLEQFRKVEEQPVQEPSAVNQADLQNQLASLGQMMSQMAQMFGKQ